MHILENFKNSSLKWVGMERLFLFLFLLSLGGLGFFLALKNTVFINKTDQGIYPSMEAYSGDVFMEGLNYQSHINGKRVMTIKAEKFTIERKKLAFLTIGLFNVAKVQNARIQIYAYDDITDTSTKKRKRLNLGDAIKEAFSKDSLKSMTKNRVVSIDLEPIDIKFFDENMLITEIKASHASIRPEQSYNIIFEGDVLVTSEKRHLSSNRMVFLHDKERFKVDGHFNFVSEKDNFSGENLTTDLYLSPR